MSHHPPSRFGRAVGALAAALAVALGVLTAAPPALADEEPANPTVTITQTTSPAGFAHPGIGVSVTDLKRARSQVLAGTEPWASYYAAMLQTRWASKTVKPAIQGSTPGVPSTTAFNSQAVQSKFIEDAFSAYTQSVEYFITGDPVYRENGMRILRLWSQMDPDKYAVYPDARIHSPIPLMRMVAAAELLRYSSVNPTDDGYDSAWQTSDTEKLSKNLVVPLTEKFLHSNDYYLSQQAYANIGAIAGYIFTDNRSRYDEAVEWFSVNSSTTDPQSSGSLVSMVRRISKDDPLNTYKKSFVQVQEMGRDQAHAWDGLNALATTARMLTVQDTKLDPVTGKVSTQRKAVSPYAFGGNRLLDGFEAFTGFMMGKKETPWIDTTGGPGRLSEAYRGRMFESLNEIYDIYSELGVNVRKKAPSVAHLFDQTEGSTYFWGTQPRNFWDSNPDYSPEYWLALPASRAGQTLPVQKDPLVQVAHRSLLLDRRSTVKSSDDGDFVRMSPSRKHSTTIGVRTLVYDDRNSSSPVGVLIRTNGPAKLELRKNPALDPYHTLSLPDTHGKWRYFVYDMGYPTLPGSLGGENLAYFTVTGRKVDVDVSTVNLQAAAQLKPAPFKTGTSATVIAVAGKPVTRTLSATPADGQKITYEAQGLPSGATLDSDSGKLTWTPSGTANPAPALVVASDGTTDTVLNVSFVVAADRAKAIEAAVKGYDPDTDYVSSTREALLKTVAGVRDSMDSADDATFLDGLVSIQDAVKKLQLLNPRLTDDTLDYPGLVTSPTLTTTAIANMTDGDVTTKVGDLLAPFVMDFGAGFRVKASAFGLRAPYGFANRSQGANVYGSNDGTNWTLLTSRETTNTTDQGYEMETIPVRAEVADKSYRFVKVQVDDPGVATDPFYPGISSFSEMRITGQRIETAQALTGISISSNNQTAGQAQNGDEVTLAIDASEAIETPDVRIEGRSATVTSTGDKRWTAKATLPANVDYGRAARFSVDYTTKDGRLGATGYATTDGSSLQLWNDHVVVATVDKSWVDSSTPQWPGTGTTAANGYRMFDGDTDTATDTLDANGWVTVKPGDGASLTFDAVRVRPRAKFVGRGNGTVLQSSKDNGKTWTTFLKIGGMTDDSQWYLFPLKDHTSIPMLRVLDDHGGNANLAEVQLLQFVDQTVVKRPWVDASTPAWPGTGSTADNGWRMFDGDLSTAPDTTTPGGWATVTPTDGSKLDFDLVSIRPRVGNPARANGTVVQGSDDGGATWTTLTTFSGVTSASQWYTFALPSTASVKALRVLDEHEGRLNVAEVRLLKFHPFPE
ncbi:putative Ig domain-containing protein [Streptomyces spongiae]|uniref:F5/8 type C domain-containing protein n=1 Tax=Streptomyces spongiae TaxID=565072 RepID=A0A5N8XF11_9ACTN|nr:putative Ig domain-containing protein [Streptomyces spongiae]MPY58052.1 hypothetical protein [Streptomyces spongiae]